MFFGVLQAKVTLQVTLDANTMPQFWFFISNQTTLQASLPQLGGSSLKTIVGDYQYAPLLKQLSYTPNPYLYGQSDGHVSKNVSRL